MVTPRGSCKLTPNRESAIGGVDNTSRFFRVESRPKSWIHAICRFVMHYRLSSFPGVEHHPTTGKICNLQRTSTLNRLPRFTHVDVFVARSMYVLERTLTGYCIMPRICIQLHCALCACSKPDVRICNLSMGRR